MARIGLAVAGVGAAVLLTACGSNNDGFTNKSAEDIVTTAKSAMKDLDAVKVEGSVSTGGQDVKLDVQTDADGNCTGSIGLGGGNAELLGVEGAAWFKPDEAFWKAAASTSADQIISMVGDKWVVVPDGSGFDEFCDVNGLLDQLLENSSDDKKYAKSDTAEVNGDDAIKIDSTNKDDETSTGYVLIDDPHYLVKIEKTEGDDTGSVTFSEFNEKFDVEAPAEDDVIDLSNASG